MKEISAFIKKEFKHIFRDKRTVLIVLVMPIIQIILFGFALSTEVHNAVVDVVGDPTDPQVAQIVHRMESNEYLEIGEFLNSPAEIDARLRKGKAAAAICFEDKFDEQRGRSGKAAVRIVADGSDPNSAQTVTVYIKGVLAGTDSDGIPTNLMYNQAMNSSYNFVPGVMGLILMLICSMMTAVSIVREKEFGTLELVLVSPVKPFWIVLSKLVPYLLLSLVNYATILLLSHYVMGVPIRGSLVLLSLVSFIFVGASLGLGLLVSIISSSQQTAMLICGMGLTMPTMILSGLIFPCESMPVILQAVSDIIPAKWYIIMVRKIMIQGAGFGDIALEALILTLMTAGLLALSTSKFKTRIS